MKGYRESAHSVKYLIALIALPAMLVIALSVYGITRVTAEDPADTAYPAQSAYPGETAGAETSLPGETDEDPYGTGQTAGTRDQENTPGPSGEPAATPAPDFAEDGTQYLHCRNATPAEVRLNGAWNAERKTLEQYEQYNGEALQAGRLFPVPGTGYEDAEALLLEKTFYIDGFGDGFAWDGERNDEGSQGGQDDRDDADSDTPDNENPDAPDNETDNDTNDSDNDTDNDAPATTGRIFLRMSGTLYEPKIFINGQPVTAARFSYGEIIADVSDFVKDGANTLSVILRNGRESVYGCGEVMGIDGDVVLSYGPGAYVERVNAIPDVDSGEVTLEVAVYDPKGVLNGEKLEVNIFELGVFENGEAAIHNGAGTDAVIIHREGAGSVSVFRLHVRLRSFDEKKRWTPEVPFLYEAVVTAGGLETNLIFGMRSAAVDENRYVTLNGNALFISGITVDRAFLAETGLGTGAEDREIAAFFDEIKGFGINTVKADNMIFPSRWYDAADKAGILLISEYPLGTAENAGKSAAYFRNEITGLARSLFNHPSHVIFDAAADGAVVPGIAEVAEELLASEYAVPVNIGLTEPASGNYVIGCNVSILGADTYPGDLPVEAPHLNNMPESVSWSIRTAEGAGIVTSLTDRILVTRGGEYASAESADWWAVETGLAGRSNTSETGNPSGTSEPSGAGNSADTNNSSDADAALSGQSGRSGPVPPPAGKSPREVLSDYYGVLRDMLAYWRTSRKYAGIILPVNVVKTGLTEAAVPGDAAGGGLFRSEFEAALGNAFAPIGLNIEAYSVEAERGGRVAVDVAVTNNTPSDLGTVEVTFTLASGSTVLYQETKQYDSLKKLGTPGRDIMRREYSFEMPRSIRDGTVVTLTAHLVVNGRTVESYRIAEVSGGATYEAPYSDTIVATVTAALGLLIFGAVAIAFFMSRNYDKRTRKQAAR
ncbi:MAG: hypothetical protein ILO53_01935 [Clostridia bacterium]|nr:hypothetical protein [Clostridia bacterium]